MIERVIMGPVKGEIQPEDRKNDRAIDAPRPHGMHRRPAAPTENSRQVIKKMITAQGRKQKHSARKGNRRFHRGKGHTGCLSNKINPFCSSSCTGRNRHRRTPHRQREQATTRDATMPETRKKNRKDGKRRAERAGVLCGKYSSTPRRVLEWLAESTLRPPASPSRTAPFPKTGNAGQQAPPEWIRTGPETTHDGLRPQGVVPPVCGDIHMFRYFISLKPTFRTVLPRLPSNTSTYSPPRFAPSLLACLRTGGGRLRARRQGPCR